MIRGSKIAGFFFILLFSSVLFSLDRCFQQNDRVYVNYVLLYQRKDYQFCWLAFLCIQVVSLQTAIQILLSLHMMDFIVYYYRQLEWCIQIVSHVFFFECPWAIFLSLLWIWYTFMPSALMINVAHSVKVMLVECKNMRTLHCFKMVIKRNYITCIGSWNIFCYLLTNIPFLWYYRVLLGH